MPLENNDTYRTLTTVSESLHKVKGSKHYGYAIPVYSENEIKEQIAVIKKEHHSARHWCYAYRLGLDKKTYRANDDGEPSNSAGPPILGQIQSFDLTNILIVVVRYFGGTKLGVGGLISAYKTAAKEAIEAGEIVEKQIKAHYVIQFPYDKMGDVMNLIKQLNLEQYDQEFDLNCEMKIIIRLSNENTTIALFQEIETLSIKRLFEV